MKAHYLLEHQLQEFINLNQNYATIIDYFRKNEQKMTINDILSYNVYDSAPLENYRTFILVSHYLAEAPKGQDYSSLYQKVLPLETTIPESIRAKILSEISILFQGALVKEIENLRKFSDIIPWLEVYKSLGNSQLNTSLFKLAIIKFIESSFLSNLLNQDFYNNLETIVPYQQLDLIPIQSLSLLTTSVLSAVSQQLILSDKDTQKINKLQSALSALQKLNNNQLAKTSLENALALLEKKVIEQLFNENENQFIRPTDLISINIDFNSIEFKENIVSSQKHSLFTINLYKYLNQSKEELVLKEYTSSTEANSDFINFEIYVAEYLSSISNDNNCFLKYHGRFSDQTRTFFLTEYINENLLMKINSMKKNNHSFSEENLFIYCKLLLNSFSEMQKMNIFHQSINPLTIVIDSNWKLKIKDFYYAHIQYLTPELKEQHFMYSSPISQAFISPEIDECIKTNVWQKFNRMKSDVFSLGMIFLYLYFMGDVQGLNSKANYERLIQKIDSVQFNWLKVLLSKMLEIDPIKRASFTESLGLLVR